MNKELRLYIPRLLLDGRLPRTPSFSPAKARRGKDEGPEGKENPFRAGGGGFPSPRHKQWIVSTRLEVGEKPC